MGFNSEFKGLNVKYNLRLLPCKRWAV